MKYYFLALGTVVAVCVGCAMDGYQPHKAAYSKGEYHAPPAEFLQRPGPMVDGPGPGVIPMLAPAPVPIVPPTTQIRFMGPDGMHIGWMMQPGAYAENQLIAPGSYNFPQAAAYRLKLTNIPGRESLALYPTLQVYPAQPQTAAYLSHVKVPVQITVEDLDQIESNNFVTKVIYLPDARFQELAIANVETLVSTRLDPGIDPIIEADKRGTIMAVLRIGNKDEEMPAGPPPMAQGDDEDINQVAYQAVDGDQGKFVPPMPIGPAGVAQPPIPGAIMMAGSGYPGQPTMDPVSGVNMPVWGMPITGTPIGLPGPPHLPYGGPANLKSHTVNNISPNYIPQGSGHVRIDVGHYPGYSVPPPVEYIKYTEKHPVFAPGEVGYPAGAGGGGFGADGFGADGAYCPPGQ
jgi:hypothetical protein